MGIELTQKCLQMLKFAPLVYLLNAYWMLSNKQIFAGEVLQRDQSDMPMQSGHTFVSTLTLNQSTPLLLICIFSCFIFILQRNYQPQLVKFGFKNTETSLKVVQNLPPFF